MIETWENRYANSMQEAMQSEIDELRAELEKIKPQESVGHLAMDGYFIQNQRYVMENGKVPRAMPLYLAPGAQPVPEGAQIDAMVNKFLQWKLPADFGPDCHISFDVIKALQWEWPTGTNLFTATQARQMIEAMLEAAKP